MKYVFKYVDDMDNVYKLKKQFCSASSVELLDEKPTEFDALVDEFMLFLQTIGFDDATIESRIKIWNDDDWDIN